MAIIEAEGLVKVYRSGKNEVRALDGLDLAVPQGTVLGLLGPNGAGKTTTVRIVSTLLRPDQGTCRVAGYDVVREAQQLRHVIGLSGQYAAVDENLTGFENLDMIGRLYRLGRETARVRARPVTGGFEEPILVAQSLDAGVARPVLRLASGTHYLQRVHAVHRLGGQPPDLRVARLVARPQPGQPVRVGRPRALDPARRQGGPNPVRVVTSPRRPARAGWQRNAP